MVGVLGAPGVHELGVGLEGVGPWKGVRERVVWCRRAVWYGALLMEALYEGQSWRPEVAVQQAEVKEEEAAATESDVCEEEPGGWRRTLHL